MRELPSTQTIAVAAASAAALATAAYHLYRNRRHERQLNTNHFPEVFQPDQVSLGAVIALSTRHPENCNSCLPSKSARSLIHTRVTTSTPKDNPPNSSFQWAVFWDIENVPVPRTTTASHFVKALRKVLAAYRDQTKPDAILRIHAIANIRRTSIRLRHHLSANGVNLTHVESKGRKDVADKALITEICLTTREYPTPFGICLISGDGDFSYAVSRLTTLGYDTVVIAPTTKSFSTLLAAVPDTVIPLSTVLEACRDPSLEPNTPLRDKSHACTTNPQKQNQAQLAKQTLAPIHASRRADRRAVRAKRCERIVLPSAGRDENDCRSSRKVAASFAQDNKPDSQVLPLHFEKSYTDKYGKVSSSAPQLLPLQHDQTQVKPVPRRRRVNQSRDNVRDNALQPQNMRTNRAGVENATQATSGKGLNGGNPRTGNNSGAQGPVGKTAGVSAKNKMRETIACKSDRRKPGSTTQVTQGETPEQNGQSNLRNKENSETRKQYPALDTIVTSDIPMRSEALWVYNGIRALPFLILFLVLVYSFVIKSLVPH